MLAGLVVGIVPFIGVPILLVLGLANPGRFRLRGQLQPIDRLRVLVAVVGAAMMAAAQYVAGSSPWTLLAPFGAVAVYVAAVRCRSVVMCSCVRRDGLALGLALAVATFFAFEMLRQVGVGSIWTALGVHENAWAAKVAVLGVVTLSALRGLPLSVSVVVLAGLSVVGTGSRSALLGLVVGSLAIGLGRVLAHQGTQAIGRANVLVRGAVLGVVAGAGAILVLFHPGLSSDLAAGFDVFLPESAADNRVRASEDIGSHPWILESVRVDVVGFDADGFSIVRLTKTGEAFGARASVPVTLEPGVPYLASFAVVPSPLGRSGLRGWAAATGEDPEIAINVVVGGSGAIVTGSGPVEGRLGTVSVGADGWLHVEVAMLVRSAHPRTLLIGPAPSLEHGGVGRSMLVSRFQIARESGASQEYVPTFAASDKALTARSRSEIFSIAFQGFLQSPVHGHGSGMFTAFQQDRDSGAFVFGHAHNLFLQVLFEMGVTGFVGLVLMLWAFTRLERHSPRASGAATGIVLGVVVMNMFDYTAHLGDVVLLVLVAVALHQHSRGSRCP